VGKEALPVCTKRNTDISARLAVPTYLLALRRDFQRLPTKVSLALGQCVKIHSSPQATLLTYEMFFDYFSGFPPSPFGAKENCSRQSKNTVKDDCICTVHAVRSLNLLI
jgi:hypothetical protein